MLLGAVHVTALGVEVEVRILMDWGTTEEHAVPSVAELNSVARLVPENAPAVACKMPALKELKVMVTVLPGVKVVVEGEARVPEEGTEPMTACVVVIMF